MKPSPSTERVAKQTETPSWQWCCEKPVPNTAQNRRPSRPSLWLILPRIVVYTTRRLIIILMMMVRHGWRLIPSCSRVMQRSIFARIWLIAISIFVHPTCLVSGRIVSITRLHANTFFSVSWRIMNWTERPSIRISSRSTMRLGWGT